MQDLHKWKEVSPILALIGVLVMILQWQCLCNNASLTNSFVTLPSIAKIPVLGIGTVGILPEFVMYMFLAHF